MYLRKIRRLNYEITGGDNLPHYFKYDDKKRTEDKIRTSQESKLSEELKGIIWREAIETNQYILYYLQSAEAFDRYGKSENSFIKFLIVDKATNYVIYESQRNSWPEFSEKYNMLKNIKEIEKITLTTETTDDII